MVLGVTNQDRDDIFDLISKYPDCVEWEELRRLQPSPEAKADADLYMPISSAEHKKMQKSLLKTYTSAKKIQYDFQNRMLALMFDTDENGNNTLAKLKLEIEARKGIKL